MTKAMLLYGSTFTLCSLRLPWFCLPEEGLSRQPDVVLLDGLPGEEQKQQQHRDTEDCGAPTAHQRTQATQAMSHQDTVTHTRRGERQDGGKVIMPHSWALSDLWLQSYISPMLLSKLFKPVWHNRIPLRWCLSPKSLCVPWVLIFSLWEVAGASHKRNTTI